MVNLACFGPGVWRVTSGVEGGLSLLHPVEWLFAGLHSSVSIDSKRLRAVL